MAGSLANLALRFTLRERALIEISVDLRNAAHALGAII
jgi:hypothetical protein